MARPSLDSFVGTKPSLDSFVTQPQSVQSAVPTPTVAEAPQSLASKIYNSVIKPVASVLPVIGPAFNTIANASTLTKAATTYPKTVIDSTKQAVQGLGNLYGGGSGGIANKIYSDISAGAQNLEEGQGVKGVLKAGGRTAADVAGAIYAPIGAAVESTGLNKLFEKIGQASQMGGDYNIINKITDNPAVQDFIQKHPNAGEDFSRTLNLLMSTGDNGKIEPSTVAERTIGQIESVPAKISENVRNMTAKSESQIDNTVISKFEKGVKPSIVGKNTQAKLNNFRSDIVDSVKTINDNKGNLQFTDEHTGETIKGQNPKTLQQLSDSIEQTKKAVFQKYDALAKQAGDAGVQVDLKGIASELDPVINSKSLSITNPKVIEYAQNLKNRLISTGSLDASTAQEVIQNYNRDLQAFYKNPSYDSASQVAIDALVANKTRVALDDGISNLTGENYQKLKNQYGSLKAIENDVVKATLRDARKNTKGLIDFADISSGGQLVHGIMSLNPATITTGLVQKGITEFYKYLNNPNRAVKGMFDAVETPATKTSTPAAKVENTSPQKMLDKSPIIKSIKDFIKDPKMGLSIKDVSGLKISEAKTKILDSVAGQIDDVISKLENPSDLTKAMSGNSEILDTLKEFRSGIKSWDTMTTKRFQELLQTMRVAGGKVSIMGEQSRTKTGQYSH